jgi:hypothetical protein
MQRLKGRKVLFGALAVLACSGDPTENQGTPTDITALPQVVFVTQGDSQAVIVSVLDEDGQALQADFTVSDVGAGITVVEDPTYLGVSSANQIRRQTRFYVKGVDLVATSFKVNALGVSKTIQATAVPGNLAATISDTNPALGDTISITVPAGTFFNESSVLTFGGVAPDVVSQDATTILFIPFPNTFGPAVVTNVGVTSNPLLTFTLATPDTVRTDSITTIGADVTPLAPALGGTVTLTLPVELRVIPESLGGLQIANAAVAPRDVAVSADSLTITFVPPPNADSFVVVPGVIARRLPQYPLELATTARVTTPVVDNVPSTVSSTTPAGGEAITLTSTDANFTFTETSEVLVGADLATTTSVAGDGSSVTFIPTPGASGPLSATGVEVVGFLLNLPSTAAAVTAGAAVAPILGTGAPLTAPTIEIPGLGVTRGFIDNGTSVGYADCGDVGLPCQVYKFVLAADAVFDVTATWSDASDIGIYFFESDGATLTGNFGCDAHGNDGTPETCTQELAAGTYFLAFVPFGPFYDPPEANPDWFKVRITGSE